MDRRVSLDPPRVAARWDTSPALRRIGQAPLGLYVHIPFCVSRCGYCAFVTEVGHTLETMERYVTRICDDIRAATAAVGGGPDAQSLYFGGGTPSLLSDAQLERIIAAAAEHFGGASQWEITIEANPESVTAQRLVAWHAAGVTRVSIGVQSTSSSVLRVLDRDHDPFVGLDAVRLCRHSAIPTVSVDLMGAIPGETDDDFARSVDAVVASGAQHVSMYLLGVEAGTPLAAQVRAGSLTVVDDDVSARRYSDADQRLTAAGFEWYELSNWATAPRHRSRHNLGYWHNDDWLGFGVGAHSHVSGDRWWNTGRLTSYLDGKVVSGGETVTDRGRRIEAIMLGLRLSEGVALPTVDDDAARRWIAGGALEVVDDRYRLTDSGRVIADRVIADLCP